MRVPPLLLLALLGLAALVGLTPRATGAPPQKRLTSLQQLENWVADFERNGPASSPEDVKRLDQLTRDLGMQALESPRRRNAITLGLLDLAGVRTVAELRTARRKHRIPEPTPQTLRIRVYGERELKLLMAADRQDELATWIASDVLPHASLPEARRLAALRLLRDEHLAATQLAFFGCALDPSLEVREHAMLALVGWDNAGVHGFMLGQLARLEEDPEWVSRATVRRHFARVTLDPDSDSGQALFGLTRLGMVDQDWRRAFRSLQLVSAIEDDPAVPALIDGLVVWIARREAGGGSRRIESEIVHELERRSDRRMGAHPDRWRQWWKVTSEKLANPKTAPVKEEETSRASFFGLRPVTDRVVFVIDRSRSMRQPFGDSGATRYSEAVDQMVRFLAELGPQTRFRVVVFSTEFDVWKQRLQPATKGNLRSAERWLRYRAPTGGTFLRPAIREVLRLDEDGAPDLRRLEADTVIVLCDGETSEGPGWVEALLAGPNEDAALAFHAVQIGGSDDGTLQALSAGSGGDFVRVMP